MARDYDTILRDALELHPAERAKLVDAIAASLASEAGVDADALITAETSRRLDDNLKKSRELEDARIQAAIDKAKQRRG